jgi:hypothetical protein
MLTVERRNVVLLYFFLEKKLSDHKLALGVLIDGLVVDSLLNIFELVLVTKMLVQMALSCTVLVGF